MIRIVLSRQTLFFSVALTAVWLSIGANSIAQEASLESKYQSLSKEILQQLRENEVRSTGVLKFAVRVGSGSFPRNVGTLNMRLAEKLEVALALANPALEKDADQMVAIVRNASATAATIPEANHLTPAGREALFSKTYPLAFKFEGQESLVPSTLIVGVAQIHEDLSAMDIELALVSKDSEELKSLAAFTVPTDLEDLMDAGESFSTRGIYFGASNVSNHSNKQKVQRVISNARQIRTSLSADGTAAGVSQHPLSPASDSPVKLKVLYDNVPQQIEFRDGAAFIKEPRRGQKVSLVVERHGSETNRFGVLVKVNGENTLYREKKPNAKSTVWVLRPDLRSFSIGGFQMNDKTRQDFVVLSDSESKQRAVDYRQDVGMISFVVYREREEDTLVLDDDVEMQKLQSQIALPKSTFASRNKLASSLFAQLSSQIGTRGLIVDGAKSDSKVRRTSFKRDQTPVVAATIRYYNDR